MQKMNEEGWLTTNFAGHIDGSGIVGVWDSILERAIHGIVVDLHLKRDISVVLESVLKFTFRERNYVGGRFSGGPEREVWRFTFRGIK